jgi:hypothetical protein
MRTIDEIYEYGIGLIIESWPIGQESSLLYLYITSVDTRQ